MDLSDYIGIAAKRENENILIITPEGSFRAFVEESVLKKHNVRLGDVFTFDLHNDKLTNYRKIDKAYDEETKIVVVGDSVEFQNIPGVLQQIPNTENFYFDVAKFNHVAYLGGKQSLAKNTSNEIGTKCRLRMRLMHEEERIGVFNNLLWGATFYGLGVVAQETHETLEIPNKPISTEPGAIIGIVTAEFLKQRYVWVKQSYPGKRISIKTKDVSISKVGSWVKLNLSREQVEQYFPVPPNPDTAVLSTTSFEAIDSLYLTKPHTPANPIIVIIPNVQIDNDKENEIIEDIDHPFFGILNDKMNKTRNVSGRYDISIIYGPVAQTKNGNLTVWSVYEINRKALNPQGRISRADQPRAGWSLGRSNPMPKVDNVNETWSTSPQKTPPALPLIKKKSKSKARSKSKQKIQEPNEQQTPSLPKIDSKNKTQPNGQGSKSLQSPTFKKTALITGISQNEENILGSTCHLWLVDDHNWKKTLPSDVWFSKSPIFRKSFYHTSQEFSELVPGLFFDGYFVENNGNFECINHLARIHYPDVLIKTCWMDRIEVSVRVYTHDVENNTTSHKLFGEIKDTCLNLLPFDCSKGVRIGIFLLRTETSYVWVIDRLIDVEQELIEAFQEAWAIDLLNKYIHLNDVESWDKLEKFYEGK